LAYITSCLELEKHVCVPSTFSRSAFQNIPENTQNLEGYPEILKAVAQVVDTMYMLDEVVGHHPKP
jgi:hypothetical protein